MTEDELPPVINRKATQPTNGLKKQPVEREAVHSSIRDWEARGGVYTDDDDDDNRLKIRRELIPDGMDYQWVTDSVFGQPFSGRRASFERKGWIAVPAERHNGMFTPKGAKGEINVDGLVLMERPLEFSIRARNKDKQRARDQVRAKEMQISGGQAIQTAFDTQHPSARAANKVGKAYEPYNGPRAQYEVPQDD